MPKVGCTVLPVHITTPDRRDQAEREKIPIQSSLLSNSCLLRAAMFLPPRRVARHKPSKRRTRLSGRCHHHEKRASNFCMRSRQRASVESVQVAFPRNQRREVVRAVPPPTVVLVSLFSTFAELVPPRTQMHEVGGKMQMRTFAGGVATFLKAQTDNRAGE